MTRFHRKSRYYVKKGLAPKHIEIKPHEAPVKPERSRESEIWEMLSPFWAWRLF